MRIETLFHWSPAARRESILRDGLLINSPPVVHVGKEGAPYLCFGTCPRRAWSLSIGSACYLDEEGWDLWQVYPDAQDEVHFLAQWGCVLAEVRIANNIPTERVWLVATRSSRLFPEEQPCE